MQNLFAGIDVDAGVLARLGSYWKTPAMVPWRVIVTRCQQGSELGTATD